MANYRFSAKVISRGGGQSVIAKAAYIHRTKLRDERTGELKDYSRGGGVLFSGIFAPKDAPAWTRDREQLWNAVERREDASTRRREAQLARDIELSLPHELTEEQRKLLLTDFVREQFVRKGMIADVAIHAPGKNSDPRNYHAHILLTMREIGPDGFGDKVREWNSRQQLEKWREEWEKIQNRYLERHGHEARVDRRTLEAQGIDREPTTHRGPHVDAMERKGMDTERGAAARETFHHNQEVAKLKRELAQVQKQIYEIEHGRAFGACRDDFKRDVAQMDKFIAEETRKREQARKFDWQGRNILDFHQVGRDTTRREPQPEPPANLRGAAADIWRTWHRAHNARSFAEGLEQRNISLAIVTKDEADSSHRDAAFARTAGNFVPEYRQGEIVAITEHGHAYRLSKRTTGDDPKEIEKFLAKLDRSQLQGLDATKRALHDRREQRLAEAQDRKEQHIAEVQAFRDILRESRAAERLKLAQKPGRQGRTRAPNDNSAPAVLRKVPLRAAGKALDTTAKLVEGIFTFLEPASSPKTPEQIEAQARQLQKQREREQQREWEREHHRKQFDRDR